MAEIINLRTAEAEARDAYYVFVIELRERGFCECRGGCERSATGKRQNPDRLFAAEVGPAAARRQSPVLKRNRPRQGGDLGAADQKSIAIAPQHIGCSRVPGKP
jgi:hypothetical protein